MPNRSSALDRRHFLKLTGTALGAGALGFPTLIPSRVLGAAGQTPPSSQFVVAHIGVGGMGGTHLNNMLRFEKEGKVRIAAVCDCDDNRLEAAWGNTGQRARNSPPRWTSRSPNCSNTASDCVGRRNTQSSIASCTRREPVTMLWLLLLP